MSKKCHICGKEVRDNYYLDSRGYTCYTCSKAIANEKSRINHIKDSLIEERKEIVKKLKKSIEYRSEHKKIIEEFKHAIVNYFLTKYDVHVNVLKFGDSFGIEKDYNYYSKQLKFCHGDAFKFNSKVLFEFCNDFECEFIHTSCEGERYVFTFEDVDMKYGFLSGR